MGDDGFGGGESSLDPLGEGTEGWESLELDRGAGAAQNASDPQELLYGAAGGRVLGDAFEGLDGPGVDLELDLGAMRAPPTDLPAPPSGPPATVARSVPPSRSLPAAPLPRRSLAPEVVVPTNPRAITLADLGEPPSGVLGSVPYALHAVLRVRSLKADLARLVRLRDGAARDVEESLIELGRALHARRDDPGLEVLAGVMKRANETGAVAGEHTAEWQRVRQAASSQRGAIADRVAAVEERAAPAREREAQLAEEQQRRDRERDRIAARRSRIQIELRNLGADDPRRAALEAELEAREAEHERAAAHAAALGPDLEAARRELATFTREIAALEKQQREVDTTRGRSEKALSSSAKAAEAAYHEAVSVVAQQALARGVAHAVDPRLTKLATNRAQALATREEEVALHEEALSLVDRPALQKGLAIVGVAAAILLAMLVFAIVR